MDSTHDPADPYTEGEMLRWIAYRRAGGTLRIDDFRRIWRVSSDEGNFDPLAFYVDAE